MPIILLFRKKHFKIAALRLFSKLYGDLRGKAKGTGSINITLCKKLVTKSVPQFKKHYDFALGFFGPHYLLNDKVDAKIKIGWVHTDYTNKNERLDVQFLLPMWDRLDWIACVSEGVEKSFQKVFPEFKDKTLIVENILSGKLIKKQAKEFDVLIIWFNERLKNENESYFSTIMGRNMFYAGIFSGEVSFVLFTLVFL